MTQEEPIREPPIVPFAKHLDTNEVWGYIQALPLSVWNVRALYLHHSYRPTPEQWVDTKDVTLWALAHNYSNKIWRDSQGRVHRGWSAGPSTFATPYGIRIFWDLREQDISVTGHNSFSRGLEMVGDYTSHLPEGVILEGTLEWFAAMCYKFRLNPYKDIYLHRDLEQTACPGYAVTRGWFMPLVADLLAKRSANPPVDPEPQEQGYVVEKGDSLWRIALKYYQDGTKWQQIAARNNIHNPALIHVGDVLVIPVLK